MLKCRKLLSGLFTATFALMLTACAQSTIPPMAGNPPPADLAQACPRIPHLSGTTGEEILPYILELHGLYKDCSARQAGLVKAWPK